MGSTLTSALLCAFFNILLNHAYYNAGHLTSGINVKRNKFYCDHGCDFVASP